MTSKTVEEWVPSFRPLYKHHTISEIKTIRLHLIFEIRPNVKSTQGGGWLLLALKQEKMRTANVYVSTV